ncbi:hypothetical protein [Acidicapsa ligni]|uniref:hypothetical protein n=1 Tax=Acidicapsa ligni TaxID=542300 RepID=UPI0021DFC7DA|nr:hypothetical protein [Acidicapsa ligni]
MRLSVAILLLLLSAMPSHAADACFTIHGRAISYCGDGQLRIWHIGTHHEFQPDDSSWATVEKWLEAGIREPEKSQMACPAGSISLVADFVICPTEPFKKGSVQTAKIVSAQNRHYVHVK